MSNRSAESPTSPAARRRTPRVRALVTLLAALCLAAACSSQAELPAGPDLMKRSAEAMRSVKSVAFAIATEGKPPVPLKRAEGSLITKGDAKGTVQIEVLGMLQELAFVLTGDTVYFKGPTGGYQTMTRAQLAQIYDPSAILDPDKGVARLLSGATGATTEAAEDVEGSRAYRVAATLPRDVVTAVVPGVRQEVKGTLWVDTASGRLVKASLPISEGANSGTVLVTLTDYDAPVTIATPAT
ncbi:LppX_LprAFG lipoprotein [Sphaerisporangium krabiense]|uniref:Lipoprotein LprG n=1 Tax=Sphaerisporangium krabiense TaxID=763782 RepID=A0A7W9DS89_9ACTN|nr:LppX_LprAFG lipoprotein [Sphaerisporangium krabiense]MBB5629437.1 lipoprotein LprG [Sphaerisporangium krabiense]